MNPRVYDTLGQVFAESIPYEPFLKGRLVADTGYFSFESKMDALTRGKPDRANASWPAPWVRPLHSLMKTTSIQSSPATGRNA